MEQKFELVLVTGAARSGKSEWAEALAARTAKEVIYIATARRNPRDREWNERIEKHRQRRAQNWKTLEVPIELSEAIADSHPSNCLLIDSLGTWVANLLHEDEDAWQIMQLKFIKSLKRAKVDIILVAEETGWGVVPAYEAGRYFRDRLGALTRQIGEISHPVYLVVGGHVLNLSVLGSPLPSKTSEPRD